jgi:hypothetical protein
MDAMIPEWRPVRASLLLLLVSAAVFTLAFTVQIVFLPDVLPIADADEARSLWVLQVAFLLRTLENIAALSGLLVLAAMLAHLVGQGIGAFWSMPRK